MATHLADQRYKLSRLQQDVVNGTRGCEFCAFPVDRTAQDLADLASDLLEELEAIDRNGR